MYIVYLHLQRYKPIIIVPTFSFAFSSAAQLFHRFDDGEGSRSVAERFGIVSKTKPSPTHTLLSGNFSCCKHSNCDQTDSQTENGDSYFDTLYDGYDIQRVLASRFINADPEKRVKLTEVVIRNY